MERQGPVAVEDEVALGVERDLPAPPRASRPADRIAATLGWIAAGSQVTGSSPARPIRTATSVPCPLPVLASEPKRSTADRLDPVELAPVAEDRHELLGGPPGAHRVRAGRADADLEDVEDADRLHARSPRSGRPAPTGAGPCPIHSTGGLGGRLSPPGRRGILIRGPRAGGPAAPSGSAGRLLQLDQAGVDRLAAAGLVAVDGDRCSCRA